VVHIERDWDGPGGHPAVPPSSSPGPQIVRDWDAGADFAGDHAAPAIAPPAGHGDGSEFADSHAHHPAAAAPTDEDMLSTQ
jgi:hypothetical protein